ncbi:K+-transporting ATPase, F subunit [Gordonia bronchialis DSM 43247]|uniref:K+-transporting ATPase, F subunit n=1 Tax=Gordonia bronchialis (strain ATCC 25592 / DSM 43247 / BCRC 13721 / JCM 3198 / KCTC 3076 / NBRC 16047 / NCTC 10667) TaxID=526226 RepID=D0L4N3_GORB4|nr:potassium-transporting ATPase subunit F [Gordonia bronchialis]ACY23258.1 K+-transporting ATPase, F subunit [Gordonia bronchialis DSM 43247]MCC3321427.1 potassium-transporting ATPase subunit F [Gordonia bronchialis]QGS23349.1 potassium-transporting ATPase subunit F [Gordonia bronchialis]UAK36289.1 potassium-transporting ATPase subunit F [Gordonia bronchialis]STQ66227.1 F subunit of K+-transporting ATPase (Potass_KdpF) [Gordonia bronchialis]
MTGAGITNILLVALAAGVVLYLVVALIAPERF